MVYPMRSRVHCNPAVMGGRIKPNVFFCSLLDSILEASVRPSYGLQT
jgi:hypothetical protein